MEKLDPDIVIEEATYGVVMALTLVTTAEMGLVTYGSRISLVAAILAMDFVWGMIDLVVFFRLDMTVQKRRIILLKSLYASDDRESMKDELNEELDGSVFDVLDDDSRARAVDVIIEGNLDNLNGIVRDTRRYLFNAVTAFLVTFLTAVPPALCILYIDPIDSAYLWATVVSSAVMFFIGYYYSPYGKRSRRVMWGITVVVAAILLTRFAAALGG